MDEAPSWRTRRPSRAGTWAWGVVLFVGYGAWCIAVDRWAATHGHAAWNREPGSLSIFLAAITYWPLAIAVWKLTYPASPRWLPWWDDDEADHPAEADEGPR